MEECLKAANSGKDTDVYDIAKTANFIRKDLLKVKNTFNGTFAENCQRESIPASLSTLLRMIMKSPTTAMSIAQHPTVDQMGCERPVDMTGPKTVQVLLKAYPNCHLSTQMYNQ